MDGASQTPHLSKTRRSGCIVALNEFSNQFEVPSIADPVRLQQKSEKP